MVNYQLFIWSVDRNIFFDLPNPFVQWLLKFSIVCDFNVDLWDRVKTLGDGWAQDDGNCISQSQKRAL